MLFFTSMTQFALTLIKNMFEVFITLEELFFPLISKLEDLAESSKVIDGTINRIDFTFFTLMIGNLLSDLLTFSAKRNKWCIFFFAKFLTLFALLSKYLNVFHMWCSKIVLNFVALMDQMIGEQTDPMRLNINEHPENILKYMLRHGIICAFLILNMIWLYKWFSYSIGCMQILIATMQIFEGYIIIVNLKYLNFPMPRYEINFWIIH